MKPMQSVFLAFLLCFALVGCDSDDSVTPLTQAEQDVLLAPAQPPAGFTSRTATVNGVNLHYVIGGQGAQVVVLLHGWPETWYEWHRIMPALAERYTVLAPDLRGIGESNRTLLPNGFDKRTLAADLRGLLQQLGYSKINLVGHDIGQMVAYAYAAQYPTDVNKLVAMDAPLPGIEPFWTGLLQDSRSWHFGFYATDGAAAANIIDIRDYLVEFIKKFSANPNAFTAEEINEIARVYSQPGALESSFGWYKAVYTLDIGHNVEHAQTKLTMPVLALGGEFSGTYMLSMWQTVATNVEGGTIPGSGHWIVQEQPQAFLDVLLPFFNK
jgi:pimeloyl-ACP methyl ester carboxylesterase